MLLCRKKESVTYSGEENEEVWLNKNHEAYISQLLNMVDRRRWRLRGTHQMFALSIGDAYWLMTLFRSAPEILQEPRDSHFQTSSL